MLLLLVVSTGASVVISLGPTSPAALLQPSAPSAHSSPGSALLSEAKASLPHDDSPATAATWVNISGKTAPPASQLSQMTYDPTDGYVVLFGGCLAQPVSSCVKYSDQTWTYSAGVWTNLTNEAVPHPSARNSVMMTWDSADGYVLLFGGVLSNGQSANDTWKFLGGTWTNLTESAGHAPSPRSYGAIFNDTADGYVVLCCGGGPSGALGDTWKFVGGSWTELSGTVSPVCCVMGTWDQADHYGLVYGGGNHGAQSSTWTFSGGSWSSGPSGLTAESGGGLAYDPAYGYDVLFGGGNGGPLSETDTYSAGSWSSQTPTLSPSPRSDFAITFDAKDGYLLIFGGASTSSGLSPFDNDTWKWVGATVSPPPLSASSAAYPTTVDVARAVNFTASASGGTPPYTFAWKFGDGGSSSAQNPTHTYSATGVYSVTLVVNDSAANTYTTAPLSITVVAGTDPTWVQVFSKVHPPALEAPTMTYDPTDGYVVLFGGCLTLPSTACTSYSDQTWTYQDGVWTNITNNAAPHPSARSEAMSTWDSTDGYLLLFGGVLQNGQSANDTWKFVGGTWTNITATAGHAPSVRSFGAIFNDTGDGYIVLCCGGGPSGALGDSWKFQGGAWSSLSTTVSPVCCVMGTYDAAAGYGLVYGGGNHGAQSTTWEFSGGSWTSGPSGITSESGAGLTYVPGYHYDLLFGGGNSGTLAETNIFSSGAWSSQAATVSPPARSDQGQTFDAHDGYVLLFGGTATGNSPFYNDTWEWYGGVPTSTPLSVSLAETPNPVDANQSIDLTSTVSGGTSPYSYAWNLGDGTTATSPSVVHAYSKAGTYTVSLTVTDHIGATGTATTSITVRSASTPSWVLLPEKSAPRGIQGDSMAYDPTDGYVVEFGGCPTGTVTSGCSSYTDETWTFANGVWTNITTSGPHPSARTFAAMTWDSADGYILLFGGDLASGQASNDTWTFLGGVWTNITASAGHAPPARGGATLFNDTVDGYVVLFGGGGSSGALGDTWKFFHGSWSALSASITPTGCVAGTMDTAAGEGVIYGGCDHGALSATWTYSGGSWSAGPTGPPAVSYPVLAYDPVYHYDVLFGGGNGGGWDETYTLAGGAWTAQSPTVSPAARCCAAETFDAKDGYVLLFGGTGTGNSPYFNDTWEWYGGPPPSPPPVAVSARASPTSVDLDENVSFNATVTGGTSPYSYAWNFDDGTTSSAPAPTHSFRVAGTYVVNLTVTDNHGEKGYSTVDVVVQPALSVSASASPTTVDAGVNVSFRSSASGGTAPYAYLWNFGDGTTDATTSAPSHAFAVAGTFLVNLTVTDAQGKKAYATTSVVVHPALGKPTLGATPNPAALGQLVNFTATETGGTLPYTYAWAFGDGQTGGNLSQIDHEYTTNGPFVATVTVTDALGTVASASVPVSISLQVSIEANGTLGAAPFLVGFTSTVTGGIPGYSYAWTFGDGGTSAEAAPSHLFSEIGNYTTSLTVTDSAGHQATKTWSVQVITGASKLSLSLAADPSLFNVGNSTTVTATLAGGHGQLTLVWQSVPSWCSVLTTTVLRCTPPSAGVYTLQATLVDSTGASVGASVTFTAQTPTTAGPSLKPSTILGVPDWDLAALAAVLAVAALVVVVIGRRRQSRYAPLGQAAIVPGPNPWAVAPSSSAPAAPASPPALPPAAGAGSAPTPPPPPDDAGHDSLGDVY